VVDFCQATRDFNVIHDPKYMNERGKHVIVPGMYILASVIKGLEELFHEGLDSFRILFNALISSGEEVLMGADRIEPHRPDHYLFAFNGRDSFSLKQERSRIYRKQDRITFPEQVHTHELPVDATQLNLFSQLIGCHNKRLSNLLFSLAYTSHVLNRAIAHPRDAIEREIFTLLDKSKNPDQVAPFYQTLDVYLNPEQPTAGEISHLNYRVLFERMVRNKAYTAYITCTRQAGRIFRARYKLIAIPDRLIMRLAKDL